MRSYDLDPPPADTLRAVAKLLAELLAATYNAHFRDANEEPLGLTGADFLREPGEDDEDDDEMAEGGEEAATAAHPAFLTGVAHTNVPLLRGHGAPVPQSIFGLFGDAEPEG